VEVHSLIISAGLLGSLYSLTVCSLEEKGALGTMAREVFLRD